MANLACANAIGALRTMDKANSTALSNKDSDVVTYSTNPISFASQASILLAVKISSFARPFPTSRGRRCVPPAPGIIPK